MLTIEWARNPVFASEDGKCIAMQVKFAEFNEVHNFGATPHDPMPYGVDLYNRALSGEFGPVGAYVAEITAAPNQPTTTGAQTL